MLARNSCYFKSQKQYKRIDFRWCRPKPTYRQIKLGQPWNWLNPYRPSRKIVFAEQPKWNALAQPLDRLPYMQHLGGTGPKNQNTDAALYPKAGFLGGTGSKIDHTDAAPLTF
jgi:hypothetical protein